MRGREGCDENPFDGKMSQEEEELFREEDLVFS
jgi:hypothetical protein